MNRRSRLAIIAAAGLGATATGLISTGAARPPEPACPVTVSAVIPAVAHPGEQVTLTGSGFTCSGGAASPPLVTVGGETRPLAGDASDGALVIDPGDAAGAVQVSVRDGRCRDCAVPSASNDDRLLLAAPVIAAARHAAPEGGRLLIDGSGLEMHGALARLTATACGEQLPVGDHGDTSIALTAPAGFCQGALTLHLDVHTRTDGATTTAIDVPAGTLDTAMVAGAVTPTHAAAGERVTVSGSGFGHAGTALLAGHPVPVTWFDRAVEVSPLAGSISGELELVRADGRRVDTGRLGVDPAPRPDAAGRTAAAAPAHIPPTPTASPAAPPGLALHSARSSGEPGHDVPFTVSLTTVGGGPLADAPVELAFARAPAADASVTPVRGVTDARGRLAGVLHLSRRPGDHVLLARAGAVSDRVTVAACCAPPLTTGVAPLSDNAVSEHGSSVATIGGLIACLVLFVAGVSLNLVTNRPRCER
ncbi:MAG TPA: hypothetical protein VH134_10845 [Candidatus Dormibacteraeota bacterium]|nr:hypothetical protein [Candidatus Dormibacteraeota bacterium]